MSSTPTRKDEGEVNPAFIHDPPCSEEPTEDNPGFSESPVGTSDIQSEDTIVVQDEPQHSRTEASVERNFQCSKGTTEEGNQDSTKDVGWGWIVALGAALIMMLINVLGPCFSIIFSQFLLELGTSSTTVGWIFNIMQFSWNFSGPILGPLLAEFSWRKVAFTCSLGVFASLFMSAFATSAWFLLLAYSILGGISCGLLSNLCFLIIPHYFVKHRGIANAIMMIGVASGPIVGPMFVRYLQVEYGFLGATLICSAVVLHCCVGAAVFRPIKRSHKKSSEEDGIGRLFLRILRGTLQNLYILKSPRAAIIAVGGALTLNSWLNFIALMPFAVQAAGYTLKDAALGVTTSAVCNLVARLIVSTLSDWPKFSMRACYMASTATIAITTVAFSLIQDITWLTVVMGAWGFGVGSYMGIYNLIMVHYMGLDKLTPTIGATFMLVGIGFVTIGPAIGLIRDVTGSYSVSMWVLAGLVVVSFILWIFMPAAVRYDERKEQKSRQDDSI